MYFILYCRCLVYIFGVGISCGLERCWNLSIHLVVTGVMFHSHMYDSFMAWAPHLYFMGMDFVSVMIFICSPMLVSMLVFSVCICSCSGSVACGCVGGGLRLL